MVYDMKVSSTFSLFLTAFLLSTVGCATQDEGSSATDSATVLSSAVEDSEFFETQPTSEMEDDFYNDYLETGGHVALIVGVGEVMDNGYNEAALNGAKTYAQAAGVSYSYYNTASDSPEAYEQTALHAIQNHAKVLVCAGPHFEQVVGKLQHQYEDVTFLLLDGVPKDSSGSEVDISKNVFCITYNEEEAGYLAGYITVLDGYRNFGFIGGEQMPSVERFGYGYLQGINDAAVSLEIADEISVEYWYSGTFLPSQKIEDYSRKWYQNGTQVIFACGGSLYQSVLISAEECDGMIIGVDSDQSDISECFLTSAMKGVETSIIHALDEYYAYGESWPEEMAGTVASYDSTNKGITLPLSDSAWRFQTVTLEEYIEVFHALSNGSFEVSDDISSHPDITISVNYHNE